MALGVFALVVLVALLRLTPSPDQASLPVAAEEDPPRVPMPDPPEVRLFAGSSASNIDSSTPTVADLASRCGELLHPVGSGYPRADDASEECQSALASRYSEAETAEALLPLARPMAWRDVFGDVAERIEAVTASIHDSDCQVDEHDLRPDLAERCAARNMAELAVLGQVCSTLLHEFDELNGNGGLDDERYLTMLDADAREWAMDNLDAGKRFTGNVVYLRQPRRVAAALNASLVDQEEYWRQRERIDDLYLRTAWLHSQCEAQREALDAMLPRAGELDGLMQRAAGLGDEFALAHSWQSRWRASKLQESNLLLAWVHLGGSHAAAVEAEWCRADRQAIEELQARSPHIENRLRVLEVAGVECGAPCTPERLRGTEQRFEQEIKAFRGAATVACLQRDDCDDMDMLDEMHRQLARANASTEAANGRVLRRSLYGRRAEALRMRYALAVEAMAAARGVPLDIRSLRRVLANPEVPLRLDDSEVEHLRGVADEMVAHALTNPRWAIPDET